MKKVFTYIVLGISLIMLSGCVSKYQKYEVITYDQLQEIKSNNETFPLVIGSSTCSACEIYEITMKAFIKKYNIKVYFVDLENLTDEERKNLSSEVNFDSTPTTVFYEDGKLTMSYNRIVGAADIHDVKNIFAKNGYIE